MPETRHPQRMPSHGTEYTNPKCADHLGVWDAVDRAICVRNSLFVGSVDGCGKEDGANQGRPAGDVAVRILQVGQETKRQKEPPLCGFVPRVCKPCTILNPQTSHMIHLLTGGSPSRSANYLCLSFCRTAMHQVSTAIQQLDVGKSTD